MHALVRRLVSIGYDPDEVSAAFAALLEKRGCETRELKDSEESVNAILDIIYSGKGGNDGSDGEGEVFGEDEAYDDEEGSDGSGGEEGEGDDDGDSDYGEAEEEGAEDADCQDAKARDGGAQARRGQARPQHFTTDLTYLSDVSWGSSSGARGV